MNRYYERSPCRLTTTTTATTTTATTTTTTCGRCAHGAVYEFAAPVTGYRAWSKATLDKYHSDDTASGFLRLVGCFESNCVCVCVCVCVSVCVSVCAPPSSPSPSLCVCILRALSLSLYLSLSLLRSPILFAIALWLSHARLPVPF